MTARLPLRVEPKERETLPSFLSRLAAMNGTNAGDFAVDMGFSLKRVLNLEATALTQLSDRAGLSPKALETLLSWTGERAGNVRMRFRGELFGSRSLRNPKVRGCPQCIREDAHEHPSPLRNTAMRGDWQLRGVGICLRHRHPLVPLWTRDNLYERYNIGDRIRDVLPAILAGDTDGEKTCASAYDVWLDQRLSNGTDETWLAEQPLSSSITFCGLLGAELIRTAIEMAPAAYSADRAANAVGFAISAQGPSAIREALDRLTKAADGALDEPKKAFGQLYVALNRAYKDDNSFDGFRAILRSCILDTWPVAPGDMVLGKPISERRLHSVLTASREAGVGVSLLNGLLTEAGAFTEGDGRPPSRKTFDCQRFAGLLKEVPSLIGPNELREAIGATRNEMASLEDDSVLLPRTRIPTVKSPWRMADGEALLAKLEGLAITADPEDPAWETIQLARKRSELSISNLIRACEVQSLTLGKRPDVFGYHGFVVQRLEVDHLAKQRAGGTAAHSMEGLSVAEFGRLIGLRSKGQLAALISSGHIRTIEVFNPKTRRTQNRLLEEDLNAFRQKFITISIIASETGLHRNSVRTLIKEAGLKAFSPDGQDFGRVYLRTTVEPLFPKLGSSIPSNSP